MSLEVHHLNSVNGRVLFPDFSWEFCNPLIGFVREVIRVIRLACPCVEGPRFSGELETVDAHEERIVERTNHVSNPSTKVARINIDVVNSIVPLGLFTGRQPCEDGVSLLDHIVVVSVVK